MKASIQIDAVREIALPALLAVALVLITGGAGAFALYASARLPAGATLTIPVWAIGLVLFLTAVVNVLIFVSVFKTLRRVARQTKNETQT
jgi:hypothetical protein